MRPDDEEKRAPGWGWGDHFLAWALTPSEWVILGISIHWPQTQTLHLKWRVGLKSLWGLCPTLWSMLCHPKDPFLNYHTPDHWVGWFGGEHLETPRPKGELPQSWAVGVPSACRWVAIAIGYQTMFSYRPTALYPFLAGPRDGSSYWTVCTLKGGGKMKSNQSTLTWLVLAPPPLIFLLWKIANIYKSKENYIINIHVSTFQFQQLLTQG